MSLTEQHFPQDSSTQVIKIMNKSLSFQNHQISERLEAKLEQFQQLQSHNPEYAFHKIRALPGCRMKLYKGSAYFGQIINARKHGRGIILYDTNRIYEGQLENDRKHGVGFEIFENKATYKGAYVNGKPEGWGTYFWPNGESYEGQWYNGLKHGKGTWKGRGGKGFYEGDWKEGKPHGKGLHVWVDGNKYEGDFLNGLKHGQGEEEFKNGDYYKGTYVNGKPENYGEYYWANNSVFKGTFRNGLRHGKGQWIKDINDPSEKYEGGYVSDKKCGYGVYEWSSGNVYKGNFFDDLRNGYGEMQWADGRYYIGMWDKGNQAGQDNIFEQKQLEEQYLIEDLDLEKSFYMQTNNFKFERKSSFQKTGSQQSKSRPLSNYQKEIRQITFENEDSRMMNETEKEVDPDVLNDRRMNMQLRNASQNCQRSKKAVGSLNNSVKVNRIPETHFTYHLAKENSFQADQLNKTTNFTNHPNGDFKRPKYQPHSILHQLK